MSQTRRRRQARKRKRRDWRRGASALLLGARHLVQAVDAYVSGQVTPLREGLVSPAVGHHVVAAAAFSEGAKLLRRGRP